MRYGRALGARMSEVATAGNPLIWMQTRKHIHHISAVHSHKNARGLPSTAFDGLRDVVNIVRGCEVVITRNVAYLHGLASGTRGKVVGVIYGHGEIRDFPEAIVVDVPEYCGSVFYEGAGMSTIATHGKHERRDEDGAQSVTNRGWVRDDGELGPGPDHKGRRCETSGWRSGSGPPRSTGRPLSRSRAQKASP